MAFVRLFNYKDTDAQSVDIKFLNEIKDKLIYTKHPADALKDNGVIFPKGLTKLFMRRVNWPLASAILLLLFSFIDWSFLLTAIILYIVVDMTMNYSGTNEIASLTTYPYVIKLSDIDGNLAKITAYSKIASITFKASINLSFSDENDYIKLKLSDMKEFVPSGILDDEDLDLLYKDILLPAHDPFIKRLVSQYTKVNS